VKTPALFLSCLAFALAQPPADLIIKNGRIATMEPAPAQPFVEALAIRTGRIVALGSSKQMTPLTGPKTRVIDLKGAFATPGLIEAHGHFMGIGQFKRSLNLRNARTWKDIVATVGAAAKEAKPGEWIIGRGFHQSKWEEPPTPNVQGFPVHADLSKVSPNNPVMLTHASGHAAMVNQKALDAAGITRDTKDPDGGEILHDALGNPTGLLNERAQGLTRAAYAEYLAKRTPAQRLADSQLEATLAAQECMSKGLTSFQDAGSGFDTVDMLRDMGKNGKMDLRLWIMLNESNASLEKSGVRYKTTGDQLTVRAIKRVIDGALGSRGAWLLAPYEDLPSSSGLNTAPVEEIEKTAQYAIANGFQLCVHAIGDRGNREVLDIFERAFQANPLKSKGLRWRIEHSQHLSPADIPRFGKLGVIASMEGVHCTSDAPYVLARLGPKRAAEGAYMWRSLIDSGAIIANGTDAPVEDVDPIPSLYASVSRKLADGTVFFPEQRMTRTEALQSYTINAAYAAFEDDRKGSLKVGKLGDVTVLSKNFLTAPEDELPKTEVLYTIIGGKVVHEKR
jgi:predicted amidohydrolase YtcJ